MSTYPPTRCGIAAFTHSLVGALSRLRGTGQDLAVARLIGPDDVLLPDANVEVVAAVDCPSWPTAVARASRHFDVVWVQHEFGVFGTHGEHAIDDLFGRVDKPIVTGLHTVLPRPSTEQKSIMDRLLSSSHAVVVMSNAARDRVVEVHRTDPSRVVVIPHGVRRYQQNGPPAHERPSVLTWGLLGPGKGIEWGIRAIAQLDHLRPRPNYVVAGATHPNVLRSQGQAYRRSLERLATDLAVSDMVTLEDAYISRERLAELLKKAQLILIPYDSTEQVTSGVLVEAIGAGKAVVATDFPHAVELLSGGAGTVVPHRDPSAMAAAVGRYLTNTDALEAAEEAAIRLRPHLLWSTVAQRCESVACAAASDRLSSKATPPAVTGRGEAYLSSRRREAGRDLRAESV